MSRVTLTLFGANNRIAADDRKPLPSIELDSQIKPETLERLSGLTPVERALFQSLSRNTDAVAA
ncbi:hypothetical protein [Sphingomonas abaci]|uniref:Uncharacterized protein n=1 Tax=Sphingomonas abaci TaxID=237611 RepID=A0A7W7AJP7_9SPHN|nr:hypothetical protein [Sphingomonas abaci]MBB4618264.1 hypothetical protein [Sphingomonas abaci]